MKINFTLDKVASQYIELYKEILKKKRSPYTLFSFTFYEIQRSGEGKFYEIQIPFLHLQKIFLVLPLIFLG